MCLIAATNECKSLFPEEHMKAAIQHNSDGFGIMYASGGRVVAIKVKSHRFEDFEAALADVPTGVPTVVHFRYATDGAKNLAMLHPFLVADKDECGTDLWMVHNGVMPYSDDADPELSDTAVFVRDVVRPILGRAPHLVRTDAMKHLLAETIGSGSKLVFLEHKGGVHIVNEEAGKWQNGVWYSNTYSLVPRSYPRYSGYATRYPAGYGWPTMYSDAPSVASALADLEDDGFIGGDKFADLEEFKRKVNEATKTASKSSFEENEEDEDDSATFRYTGSLSEILSLTNSELYDFVANRPEEACDALLDAINRRYHAA